MNAHRNSHIEQGVGWQWARFRLVGRYLLVRVAAPWLLSRGSLDRVLARLVPMAGRGGRHGFPPTVFRFAERILSASRIVPDTCLYRALARYAALYRHGEPVRFVLGVRGQAGGELESHAWVTYEGRAMLEATPPEFEIVFSHPAHA